MGGEEVLFKGRIARYGKEVRKNGSRTINLNNAKERL